MRDRGRVVQCYCVAFKCTGAFLQLKLPSGRKISYPNPRIKVVSPREQVVLFSDNAAGQFVDCRHGHGAYGATWTENIVSGIARDLLFEAMQRVEAAGYPIVFHCHDEIIAEVPEGSADTKNFARLMTSPELGVRTADRGRCLERTPLLQIIRRRHRHASADARACESPDT